MEIIETIPIYGPPNWTFILMGISVAVIVVSFVLFHDTEYVGLIITCIAGLAFIIGMIAMITLNNSEFSHNEYIVRITDMPAQEFVEKYEVTRHFDYSDVIQVREIEEK